MTIFPGKFITFEGGEGTGKSTQVRLMSEALSKLNVRNIASKEPGGTELGLEIRRLLVTGDKDKMDPLTEILLYFADRRAHLTQKVWPAMENGTWVLSDRFADSSVAYQYYGYDKRLSKETLDMLYRTAVGNFKPDLTIILDIDPEIGLKRSYAKAGTMAVKETRFESRGLEFHQKLRNGFLAIAKEDPQRCVVINADKPIDMLHEEIFNLIMKRFEGELCRR